MTDRTIRCTVRRCSQYVKLQTYDDCCNSFFMRHAVKLHTFVLFCLCCSRTVPKCWKTEKGRFSASSVEGRGAVLICDLPFLVLCCVVGWWPSDARVLGIRSLRRALACFFTYCVFGELAKWPGAVCASVHSKVVVTSGAISLCIPCLPAVEPAGIPRSVHDNHVHGEHVVLHNGHLQAGRAARHSGEYAYSTCLPPSVCLSRCSRATTFAITMCTLFVGGGGEGLSLFGVADCSYATTYDRCELRMQCRRALSTCRG